VDDVIEHWPELCECGHVFAAGELLVTNALGMAVNRRAPKEGGIIHSDQGVQFASWVFSQKVTEAGLAPSVGAVGAPFDNAMVEAFWARMQVELLNRGVSDEVCVVGVTDSACVPGQDRREAVGVAAILTRARPGKDPSSCRR
jgi:transposase InsO family protein